MTRRRASTPVSPKVTASTTGGAAATVLGYVLGTLPVIDGWPPVVRAALLVLLMAAGTFAAGYLKRDPLRRPRYAPGGITGTSEVPPPGSTRLS